MWYLTDTKTIINKHDEDLANLIWNTLEDIDIVNYINNFKAGTVFIPYIGDVTFGEAAVAIANDRCQFSDLAYDIAQDIASDILSEMESFEIGDTKTVYYSHYIITSDSE